MKRPTSRTGTIDKPYVAKDGTTSYRIRWYDHDGVRDSETVTGDRRAAQRRLDTRLREVQEVIDGHRAPPSEAAPTLEAIAVRVAREVLPLRQAVPQQLETLKRLRHWFAPLLATPINHITTADIRAILAARRAMGRSPATCNRALSALSVMCQAAQEWGHIERNPCRAPRLRGREGRKAPKFLRPREARAVLNAAETPYWRAFFALAIYAGARLSEITGLLCADVEYELQTITIRRSVGDATKSGHHRILPMHDELIGYLEAHRPTPSSTPDHLFFPGRARRTGQADPTSDRLSGGAAYRALKRTLKTAGIKKAIGVHALRHTFSSLFIAGGGNVRELQELLGHSSLQMTARYVHSLGLTSTTIGRLKLPKLEE